jgi:hypothetical protein
MGAAVVRHCLVDVNVNYGYRAAQNFSLTFSQVDVGF